MSRRHICYVTGTRADFGLMRSTLLRVHATPNLSLSLVATGMHLDPGFGHTVDEVEAAGPPVVAKIPLPEGPSSGATMARHIGIMTTGFVDSFIAADPDIVLLLGDRGEMLAAAIAAIHLNIHIAHIAGGDRSGTIDEPIRHAISKLSHFHLTSTEQSRDRLIRMGENPDHIHVVGTPSLDDILDTRVAPREEVLRPFGLDPDRPFALVVFHPVVQDALDAGRQCQEILVALEGADLQAIALMPNSDAGSDAIQGVLNVASGRAGFSVQTHLPRPAFLQVLAHADVMVGNSSSGIVEAASFGTPVVNVGPRQSSRERNANVVDVPCLASDILAGLQRGLGAGRASAPNVYGDGRSGERICRFLESVDLDPAVLKKLNAY